MSGKHTPGPWRVGWWGGCCRNPIHVAALRHPGPPECVYEPELFDGNGIAGSEPGQMVVDTIYDELVIKEADANLISAAPDLLEALKVMLADELALAASGDCGYYNVEAMPSVIAARAAIAKAEGR